MEDVSFQVLLNAPLHRFSAEEWTNWYPHMACWLDSEDASSRSAALERLAMGVFRAEPMSQARTIRAANRDAACGRTFWLLDKVERTHARHPELLSAFLDHLRWHGHNDPFPDVLLPWLQDLRRRRLPGVADDLVEGTLILIGGLPWTNRSELPPLLDHPSNYVRSCVARVMNSTGVFDGQEDDSLDYFNTDLLAKLTAKELERPGVAGPFWSGCEFDGYAVTDGDATGFDPVDWMLDIIEHRSGPEPTDMAFNGIDFYVHELAAGNPEAVRRLVRAGRTDLALMTATEFHDIVAGMAPVLRELAAHPNAIIADAAQIHLANYYGEAFRGGDRVRHLPDWEPGVDAFVIRHGDSDSWVDSVVFFPTDRGTFDNAKAWAMIDVALPPELRGELAKYYLAGYDDEPGPVRLGQDELRSYTSGGQVKLFGDAGGRGWRRLEIIGSRLQNHWQPLNWRTKPTEL